VTGDRFDFYDPADNSQATIYWKPSTQDAIEGAGSLASTTATGGSQKYHEDLMIQAQVCAAINRHAIYTNSGVGEIQYNHDPSRFFKIAPYNQYVKFFHSEDISYLSQTYAFAYDDVGDQSSTIQCTFPTKVLVVIGGYGKEVKTPISIPGILQAEAYSTMSGVQTEVCTDIDGGFNVGYIEDNDWMEYDVTVAKSANYDFSFRSASMSAGGEIMILLDGKTIIEAANLDVTGDWQNWTSSQIKNALLTEGSHKLKIIAVSGRFNLNYVDIKESNALSVAEDIKQVYSVYPNPAKAVLNIEGLEDNTTWTIVNIQGQVLMSGSTTQINTLDLAQGIYLLELSNGQNIKFTK
jgi:hypothetical protein